MESLNNDIQKLYVSSSDKIKYNISQDKSLLEPGIVKEIPITQVEFDQEENKIVNKTYKVLKLLGTGSYSNVRLVEDINSNKNYCFKIINEMLLEKKRKSFSRDEDGNAVIHTMLDDVKKEISILKKLNSDNIVRLYEILVDEENRKKYLVMELAELGSLMTYDDEQEKFILNNSLVEEGEDFFKEEIIKSVLFGVAKALDYLHSNNIVHRDLKPDNIIIHQENDIVIPKLCDFSIASELGDSDILTRTEGNNFFFAPELCSGNKEFIAKPVDIWSFGVCAYVMVYNTLPILPKNKHNMMELFDLIKIGEIEYPETNRNISKELIDLIKKCLQKNPLIRITAEEILKHPYFFKGAYANVCKKTSGNSVTSSIKSPKKTDSKQSGNFSLPSKSPNKPKGYFSNEMVSYYLYI